MADNNNTTTTTTITASDTPLPDLKVVGTEFFKLNDHVNSQHQFKIDVVKSINSGFEDMKKQMKLMFTNVHARGHNACILGEDQPFNPLLSNTGERVNSFPLDIKALKAMQGRDLRHLLRDLGVRVPAESDDMREVFLRFIGLQNEKVLKEFL